ncbi:MAG: hypothetical protein LBE35_04140 [Clostridiales bacterium]|nr:hypothetical protein [Clostridiales bacterium]
MDWGAVFVDEDEIFVMVGLGVVVAGFAVVGVGAVVAWAVMIPAIPHITQL